MIHLTVLVKCTRIEILEGSPGACVTAHFRALGAAYPRELHVSAPTAESFIVGKVYDLTLESHS